MVTVGSSTPVVVAVGSTPINILRRALCRRWQQHPCCCRRWQQSPNKILRRALNCRRREQHPSCCRRWQHHNCESKNFVEGTVSPSLHSYKLDHWSRWRWRWRMPKLEPHTVNIPCASTHTAPTRPCWLYHCGRQEAQLSLSLEPKQLQTNRKAEFRSAADSPSMRALRVDMHWQSLVRWHGVWHVPEQVLDRDFPMGRP